jgi:hypothetical protein
MPYQPFRPMRGHQPDGAGFSGEEQRVLHEIEQRDLAAEHEAMEAKREAAAGRPSFLDRLKARLRR